MKFGRPREFDIDEALEAALRVFRMKGYEATSLSDLTAAMGITRPSLYAAFGNKEDLFRKALNRYAEERRKFWKTALEEPTARKVAEKLLRGSADLLTEQGCPPGCLAVQSTFACGEESDAIREELLSRRSEAETAIRQRFARAKSEGDLPSGASPGDLARYIVAVFQGMAVQAASGATRKDLRRIADTALRAWPA